MSGSTIGGVVGGVVGWFVGGPQGAYYGWMIGSAVGGYVDPEVIEGPRLKDLRATTSTVGGAIPRAWGSAPVPCNIIWDAPAIEHRNRESGKGGPEQVTYTYTRSYAVMFHLGEIAGVLQIKRNGKLVYDARDDATLQAEYLAAVAGSTVADALNEIRLKRAMNSRFMSLCTLYKGTQDQDPDPTIESYLGVGNVPAYRGRAYMVVTDDDVTELSGAIPQYEVIVAVCGTVSTSAATGARWIATFQTDGTTLEISPDAYDWSGTPFAVSGWSPGIGTSTAKHGEGILFFFNGVSLYSPNFGEDFFCNSTGLGSSGLGAVWLGGYWHVANTAGAWRSPDGINFAITGASTDALGKVGSRLVGIRHAGDPGQVLVSDDYGTSWSSLGFLPNSFNPSAQTRLADDGGSTLACICVENGSFGGGADTDRRLHILYTTDEGVSWTQAPNPLPDVLDSVATTYIHYATTLGLWVVAFHDRVAYGTSIAALTLSPHIFPSAPTHVDSDAGLIVACGAIGMIQTSTDGEDWEAQSFGSTRDIHAIMSLYDPYSLSAVPDAPAYYVDESGNVTGPPASVLTPCGTTTIGEVVGELCELSGLESSEYDVSQLTDVITGYVVARETDGAAVIESLRPIGMFDPGEWDGKARFTKRSGVASGSINYDDLVERDGDAFENETVQEAELLRSVAIGYFDPAASYAANTQQYERRAATVRALGQATYEVSAVLTADQAALCAKRKVLVAWGEPGKQKLSLPYRLAKYTPTDILNYTDEDAEVHSVRIMQLAEDSGVRLLESATNCPEAYNTTASGVAPNPPAPTDSGLRGPTQLVVMDLPLWRISDTDDIGLYIAGSGYLSGWTGAQIDVSEDAGATYTTMAQVTEESTIGYTTTDLTAWVSSENPEEQSVTVYLPDAPSSVSYETLVRYANRAAVRLDSGSWEILQYQTVAALGDDLYTLSGLIRGRYNTTPGVISAGADFVLLDSSVQFVRADRDSLGQTLTVRATTYGTNPDAADPFDFEFTDGASQTEWPVHNVEVYRDSAGDIESSCILRARLGTEPSPYQSVHFGGVRFNYSDGVDTVSYDVSAAIIGTSPTASHTYRFAQQIADFGSIPSGGITVTIAPINNITGEGQASAGITV